MKGIFAVLLLCLVFSSDVLAQSGNASVGGFVQDASQAFIPGRNGHGDKRSNWNHDDRDHQ